MSHKIYIDEGGRYIVDNGTAEFEIPNVRQVSMDEITGQTTIVLGDVPLVSMQYEDGVCPSYYPATEPWREA